MADVGAPDHKVAEPPAWSVPALLVAAVLLLVHGVLVWTMRAPGYTMGVDPDRYLLLARALRAFSYVELWTDGTPVHAMYPPGYPALLALIGAVGPAQADLAVAANVVLSMLGLGCVAVLAGRISPWVAVAVLVACVANTTMLWPASRVLSETLFTSLSMLGLVLLTARDRRPQWVVLGGAVAVAAALTRSIGMALVLAVLAEWLLARRWRAMGIFAIAAALTVGGWFLWTVQAPRLVAGYSYLADATLVRPETGQQTRVAANTAAVTPSSSIPAKPTPEQRVIAPAPLLLRTLLGRVRANVPFYLTRVIPAALYQPTISGTIVDNAIGLLILLVAGGAGLLALSASYRLLILYVVAYAGVLAMWPYAEGRFLAPILPLIVFVVFAGIHAAGVRFAAARGSWLCIGAIASLLGVNAFLSALARIDAETSCGDRGDILVSPDCVYPPLSDFWAAIRAADRVAPRGAPFFSPRAPTVYFMTGRRTIQQAEALTIRDPDAFLDLLRSRQVGAVILGRVQIGYWRVAPMMEARCNAFELIEAFGERTFVMRLATRPTPETRKAACDAIHQWASGDWYEDVGRTFGRRLQPPSAPRPVTPAAPR